jgi:hypothetical protein
VAASTPGGGEAECFQCLLVLRVYCTSILERRHLLARLVVIIVWVVVLIFAGLDLAIGLSSQGPP